MNQYHVIGEKRIGLKIEKFYIHADGSGAIHCSRTKPIAMPKADAEQIYHYAQIYMRDLALKLQTA